jgi:nicotinate-nucleotide pyrophosphorylase (carboxylating)
MDPLSPDAYRDLVGRALAEDLGSGDVTTQAIVPPDERAHATIFAKSPLVLAGLDVAIEVWRQLHPAISVRLIHKDAEACEPGQPLARVEGPAAAILTGERTALNFLQHLTGIATLTRRFVDAAHGAVSILDTRKTIPAMRALEKYAVRCGGGVSHRAGLFDAVLIKDNHIRVAGSIGEAVRRVRAKGWMDAIEVETENLAQVDDALHARAEIIMLDNMDDATMRAAVRRIGGRAKVEISGRVTLDRVPALAALGADCLSVGALTHSAPAADISLEIEFGETPSRSGAR